MTKPGLKVFHLQRISGTKFEEFELLADERYLRLKSEIFSPDIMKSLSPAQIIAAAVSLGRLGGRDRRDWGLICNSVMKLAESSQYRLSPSEIGVALYAIARSGNCGSAKDRFLVPVLKRFLQESAEWSPIDMGWVLYFLRKKEVRDLPCWHRTTKQLAYRFNEHVVSMTPKQISCILSEFGYMKLLPGSAIQSALTTLESRRRKLDPKTTCLMLAALAKLKVYRSDFLFRIAPQVEKMISDRNVTSVREVTSMMFSLSKLDWFNRGIVKTVCRRLLEERGIISNHDVSMIAYGLGRLGVGSCSETWKAISSELAKRIDSMSPLHVSMVVASLGKVGYRDDDPLFERVVARVLSDIKGYTERQLVTVLNGLANCQYASAIQLPKNLTVTHVNEFQVNKILLFQQRDPPEHSKPIMSPRRVCSIHNKIKDLLHANDLGCGSIEINKLIGAVYVDVFLELEGRPTAIILLGDSDVCKLDKQVLLGPSSWVVNYLQDRMKCQVFHVHRNLLQKAESLSAIPGLGKFNAVFQWCKPKKRNTFVFDNESGKVSFTNSYLVGLS